MICEICPRECRVDRKTNKGVCGVGNNMVVNTYSVFMYEEPCISGKNGSGAIFFSGCSLKCVFCQNYQISHSDRGEVVSTNRLVEIMQELEQKGVNNINFVSPTHFTSQIIEALKIYKPKVPIVWNTHGYEKPEIIEKIIPYVDIFLTDFKYFDEKTAKKYSKCPDYVEYVKNSLEIMANKKPLIFDGELLKQGVIVRHLVLPLHTQESKNILKYLKEKYDTKILVSVMSQFTPFGECDNFDEINRKLTTREIDTVNKYFVDLGLEGYTQSKKSANTKYIPEWK